MKEAVGIIGYGNIGSAIGQGLKQEFTVCAFDKDKAKAAGLSGISVAGDVLSLINASGTLILSVKPQDFEGLLKEISAAVGERLVISVAAGVSINYIENILGKTRVIRAMPNLPIKVGRGITCLSKGRFASRGDLEAAKRLFDNLGKTMLIEESLMNAATALSGSGPGFFFSLLEYKLETDWANYAQNEFIPALVAAAQAIGFRPEQARILADTTTQGSIALLRKTGLSTGILCKQVASKGGTTEAGLKELKNIQSLEAAVKAALKRAEELSGAY